MFKAMKIGFGLVLGAKMAEFVYNVAIGVTHEYENRKVTKKEKEYCL